MIFPARKNRNESTQAHIFHSSLVPVFMKELMDRLEKKASVQGGKTTSGLLRTWMKWSRGKEGGFPIRTGLWSGCSWVFQSAGVAVLPVIRQVPQCSGTREKPGAKTLPHDII